MKPARRFPPGRTFELIEQKSEADMPRSTGEPVRLSPIPWGQPDRALARALFSHLAIVNAIVIPFHPKNHGRVRAWLLSHGITH